MKKFILSLAVALSALSGFAQDNDQEYKQKTCDAFAKVLSPYLDEVHFFYDKGLFTSIQLSFYTHGDYKTLYYKSCPREVTGVASLSEDDYKTAKKGATAIRKLLLEEIKNKRQTEVYLGRMFSGTSPMIFRVVCETNNKLYFDINLTDEEVFGVPFDQVDKKAIVSSIMDYLGERGDKNMSVSDDGNWLVYSYKRSNNQYRTGEAFSRAQQLGAKLYPATERKYLESKPYHYLAVPFGMGIMVEVINQDTKETVREWITPEEMREFCLEEDHKYHGPYLNSWFLKLQGAGNAVIREYSDAFTIDLWCTWYDLLGGEWTVERIMDLIQQSMSEPNSKMGEIIESCKASGKPFHAVLNSRFGLRINGQLPIE